MTVRCLSPLVVSFFFCLLLPGAVLADKPRYGDTFSFSLGYLDHRGTGKFRTRHDADAPNQGPGLDDLKLKGTTKVGWGDLAWRFSERWEAGLTYTNFKSTGSTTAGRSGNFEGIDWEIGATLDSRIKMDVYIADIKWDFLRTDKAHLGAGVGLHVVKLDFDLDVSAFATINGQTGTVLLGSESTSVTAPLPDLTLQGGYMITDKLYLDAQINYFNLNYKKYSGQLWSAKAGIEWRPFDHFGIGAAYQHIDMDLKIDQHYSDQKYNLRFFGPLIFISAGF